MTHNITIAGVGLIGSSLARAARARGLAGSIVALEATPERCREVIDLALADAAYTDPARAVRGADMVVLAVPVGQMGAVAAAIGPHLAPGAIVTDTGSVKRAVVEAVTPHIPAHATFVPGHPVAGTEKSGPAAGFAELFAERWVVLTPAPETPIRAVEAVTALWEACGARLAFMDSERHDLVLAMTSHLPQLIASTIVGTAAHLSADLREEVVRYAAGGFRDFTRIAASDPTMWRDIFLANRWAALEVLDRFETDLAAARTAIESGDGQALYDLVSRGRAIREGVVAAGQATPEEAKRGAAS
ncbi:MAG TPA: prephenate/arogenate dehydrogenase family protein [Rhodospirillaceae bacterium]|jgi:cyclohexadieny/prephenate dehydrogenase|nr:prephenate dehydrogenase/arogenate dehydrogenase family protein [Alphaproteobacteria bacterium]HBH25833.1 prephenate/arogenate dehydrogenase family protein [Rhodospirillaceae bacterium]